MNRTKYFAMNSAFAIFNQLIVMIAGFITPRIMLVYFGSSINGLVSSITQFINYFNIVEAGLASAAVFALYSPLSKSDINKVNGIVSATKKYYFQTGYLFTLLVVGLAFIYPFIVKMEVLTNFEISVLVILLGAKGFLNFFSMAKYRALLTASQRVYVISISTSMYTILNTMLIILLSYLKLDILSIYFFSIFALIARNLILSLYVKNNFPEINFNSTPDFKSLDKRWDALILQFVNLAQNTAPTLIITFFASLSHVSIFSIYNMVISGIQGVLGIFTNSLSSSFGDIIARNNQEHLSKVYNEFEAIYLMGITIVYSTTFIMLLPFVNIYTSGITDVNYNLPIVSFLMALNGFLYIIKTPQGMIITSAGHFKETKGRATIQAIIIIFGGVILSIPFKLHGVIMAMIISNIYRFIDMFVYVPKYIIKDGYKNSLKNYLIVFCIMITSFVLNSFLPLDSITNYIEWTFYAFIITISTVFITLFYNYFFNKGILISIFTRLKFLIVK